jgi:DNA-binding beta-propeller fold protein YncE
MMIVPNFQSSGNILNNSPTQVTPSNFLNAPVKSDISNSILSANINTDAFIADGNSTISILNTQGTAPVQYLFLGAKASISSSVAVTPNGSSILVGTSNDMGLNIINTTTLQTMKIIPTPATKDESNITISPNGYYAYVSGSDSYNISVVSLLTYTVLKVLNVSYDPGKMVISLNGTMGFSFSGKTPAGGTSETFTEINTTSNKVIANITNGNLNNPDTGAFSPNGTYLLIGNKGNCTISVAKFTPDGLDIYSHFNPGAKTQSIIFNLQGTEIYIGGKNPESHTNKGGAYVSVYNTKGFSYSYSINLTQTNSSSVVGMSLVSISTLYVSIKNPNMIVKVGIGLSSLSTILCNDGNLTNPLTPGQITYFHTAFYISFKVFESGLAAKSNWNLLLGGVNYNSNKTYVNVTSYYGSQPYILSSPNYYLFHNSSGYLNVNFTSSFSFEAYYALNSNESRNYAILSENSTCTGSPVLSTVNNTYLASLPTGYKSLSNAITPNGTLLLSLDDYTIPSLRIINMHTFQQIANISLPNEINPCFVSINPDGLYAYVSAFSSNLSVISLETLSIVKVLNVSFAPSHMAFLPNGTEGFTTSVSNYNCKGTPKNFTVINTETNTVIKNVTNANLSNSGNDAVSPNGTYLVISNNHNVTIFNTKTLNIVKSVQINRYYIGTVKFSPNGSKLYVTSNYFGNVNFSEIWMSNFTLHTIFSSNNVGTHFAFNRNESEVYFPGSNSIAVAYNMDNFSKFTDIKAYSNGYSRIIIPASSYYGSVNFIENGLSANTPWSLTLNGLKYTSTCSKITAYSFTGIQNYSINIPTGYMLSERNSGQIMVSYENNTVNLTFIIPAITFKETGLGSNPIWYLEINGYNSSKEITSGIYNTGLLFGTYEAIASSPYAQTYYLNFTFSTTGQTFTIPFKAQYNFSVSQTGLSNVIWYLNITNKTGMVSQMSGTGLTLTSTLINGSYNYTVSSSNKIYKPSVYYGNFTINGSSYAIREVFIPQTYNVTFSETGLPSGIVWYVNLTNGMKSGPITFPTYTFLVTNGSVGYTISGTGGYSANKTSGSITVNGYNISISMKFSKPSSSAPPTTQIEEYLIIGAVVAIALIGAFIWKRRSP